MSKVLVERKGRCYGESHIITIPREFIGDLIGKDDFKARCDQQKYSIYVFSWDKVLSSEKEKLRNFLRKKFDVDWVTKAKIKKINDNTIDVSSGDKSIKIRKIPYEDDKKKTIEIKPNKSKPYKLKWEKEGDKTNIYDTKAACSSCRYKKLDLTMIPGNPLNIFSEREFDRKPDYRLLRYTYADISNVEKKKIKDRVLDDFQCSFIAGYRTIWFHFEHKGEEELEDWIRQELMSNEKRHEKKHRRKGLRYYLALMESPPTPITKYYRRGTKGGIKIEEINEPDPKWSVYKLEFKPTEKICEEAKIPAREILECIYQQCKIDLFNIREFIQNKKSKITIDDIWKADDFVNVRWWMLTRIQLKKIYSKEIYIHEEEKSYESPVGVVYGQAGGKTLEKFHDKFISFADPLDKLNAENLLERISEDKKEGLSELLKELADHLEEVEKFTMDLEEETTQEKIEDMRTKRNEFEKKAKSLEKKLLKEEKLADVDRYKSAVWGRHIGAVIDSAIGMRNNLHSLFSWRVAVRTGEFQG